ncbi:carotenoid oxygenase family protein [Geobacter sulfurreducens]|uniref:carotenoid oxygenase family protein n=1 Tax=Geobacter sulfurreducens TaxID=35554 RepID=UPI002BBB3249|nr:carotenoid oxygenase family protein [Geobacter sulfurreducens]HML77223.1 carotenoid oxygenase family protein [Geobacter sulfurreducens]
MNRRDFLKNAGLAGIALGLPGCARSLPFGRDVFPDFGDDARPYLGLATSLREEHDYEARAEGTIPAGLRGTLYRNGPALFDRGGMRKRTLLDGDGMVQAFRFGDRGIRYANRFVRTRKFVEEEAAGRFLHPTWSTQAPGGIWTNVWPTERLLSQAGITVFPWRGRLYAFDESSFPYELNPDTLETVGETTFGLPRDLTTYSAHGKFDPATGEWLHFGISYGPRTFVHLTTFNVDGTLRRHRALELPRAIYMHDWFVTERHAVFHLHPVEIAYWPFLLGIRSMAESLRWRPERGTILMVVERDSETPPRLVETEACYLWHTFNAWEERGGITADFVGYRNPDHFISDDPVITAVMLGRRGTYSYPGEVMRYRIDPAKGTAAREVLHQGSCEWPRIDERLRCRPHRTGYMLRCLPGEFFWSIVMGLDPVTGRTDEYSFGRGVYCTEPVFAPRPDTPAGGPGWLLVEIYDSHTRTSSLAIFDADGIAGGPLALVRLTHHVPFSYHGWWHPAS